MCSRDEQSVTSSNKEQLKDGCSKGEPSSIGYKNCQDEENSIMWPVKPKKDMWSDELAMLMQHKVSKKSTNRSSKIKKLIGLANGKTCQATTCENTGSKSQLSTCSDRNSQEIMWAVMPEIDMWSLKLAIRRFCKEKKCQSTRCYTKYDKNCQSARMM